VIIARPRAICGITFLPRIMKELPKTIKFVVIGKADATGKDVLGFLKGKGFNIEYLGYVSETEKWEIFSRFSHYLHLGLNESFGITIVEAMAAGCIPVAPRSGGIPEYVPPQLLYSNHQEAYEKISSQIGLGDSDLEMVLKNISKQFDEKKFRRGIAAYINMLDAKSLQRIN
jgi:glycosyltransferase involved in cell wall biosynthesis